MEIKELVENKVMECYDIASKKLNTQFEICDIDYSLTGVVCGIARYLENKISLNMPIMLQNTEHYIKQTIPHEVAHLISVNHFGRLKGQGHGKYWKYIMEHIFNLPSTRCHSYDVSAYQRIKTRYIVKCNCKEHHVTKRVIDKMINENRNYKCNLCHTNVLYTGKSITFK